MGMRSKRQTITGTASLAATTIIGMPERADTFSRSWSDHIDVQGQNLR